MGTARYRISILSRELSASALIDCERLLSSLDCEVLEKQTVPAGQVADSACVHYTVQTSEQPKALREALTALTAIDVVVLPCQTSIHPRLIAFDMDSTLINVEVIDELASLAGVGHQVAAITEAAMRGELDFPQSFRSRVALLKGLEEVRVREVFKRIHLNDGAARLISTLKEHGCKVAVLSGGFSFVGDWLRETLDLDYVHTNVLDFENGLVTGDVTHEIVDAHRKAHYLKSIAESEHLPLSSTIAVGDGANDILMLQAAGLGVAFRAKPKVREVVPVALSHVGLDSILHLVEL